MDTKETVPQGDAGPPKLTVTQNQELADELSALLDTFEAKVPNFEQLHPSTLPFVRAHRFVPTPFLGSVIAAVAETPELQGVNKLDVNQAREVLQFIDAFRPIEEKLLALAHGIHFTIEMRRAGLAADALQIYSIAKGVIRDPGSAPLVQHIETMKRDLGRSRPKKKKPDTPATPPGTTTPPSTVPGSGGAQK
jgi:hypothetical protein